MSDCLFSLFQKSVGPKCQFVEHVGSWDPIRNERGEQLVALNVERISYWLSEGATCSNGVAPLLGRFSTQKSNSVYLKSRFYP